MTTTKLIPATTWAITVDQVKAQARFDAADEDTLIERLIAAAHDYAETELQRSIMPTTWVKRLPCFPCGGIELLFPTVSAVSHVKYYDSAGTLTTLDTSLYQTDLYRLPALVAPAPGTTWPSTQLDRLNAVQVTYVAGWADAAAVPSSVKTWLLLYATHLFQNRELVLAGTSLAPVPFIDGLLDAHRVVKA